MKSLRKRVRNGPWDEMYLSFYDRVSYDLWEMVWRDITSRVGVSEEVAEIVMNKMFDHDPRL